MYVVQGPRRLQFGSRVALLWTVVIDEVPHRVAWRPDDGALRVAFPVDDDEWSDWLRLGPRYSPRRSLNGAQESVAAWAARQCERGPGRHAHEHADA